MGLAGKVAIITGASRGIGRSVALKLAREGADIVIAAKTTEPDSRLPGTIYETAQEIEALGRRALPIKTNVREEGDIQHMVDATLAAFGRVDIMVNNAGAMWWYPVLETPAKRFDLMIDVNVRAAFLCARAVLPSMITQRWGHIINMSPPIDLSVLPGKVGYFISKFGMTMVALGLAEEVREHNVAVNALWPVTIIESQASINFGLGEPSMWRKPEILADAVYAIVCREPGTYSGQALLDEDVLRAEGITDFDPYNCVPGSQPARIAWDVSAGKTSKS
ncbi:MAG: SDR family NAD(P)-dependent oxidoreductase [Chloroflexi bacterium]|nr:SDR family NAD(P)-dependent oxidoreductase [Chloroflexota bacterium]